MDGDIIAPKGRSEMMNMTSDMLGGFNFRILLFLYLIFIIICSDVFVDRVLTKFDGAVDMHVPTTYGTCVQGGLLVGAFVVADVLVKMEVL